MSRDKTAFGLDPSFASVPRFLTVLLVCVFVAGLPVRAAQTTSAIQGNILDAQGGAIVGAEIVLIAPMLAREIMSSSDLSGSYRLSGLPPGSYQDPSLRTPHTRNFPLGLQREITSSLVVQADYYHREIRDMLGVRISNLAFAARLPDRRGELQPGTGDKPILSYGPFYEGNYDAIGIGIHKRLSKQFMFESFYTWAKATDNALNSSFVSQVQTGRGAGLLAAYGPTDNFVGVPPLVTDPLTGQTNSNGSFVASNGNPVPQAGKFYNGANLDYGPSDLAFNRTLIAHGLVTLPWQLAISIFRAQSGFHFSVAAPAPVDVDGDGLLNGIDFIAGRNPLSGCTLYQSRAARRQAFFPGGKDASATPVRVFQFAQSSKPGCGAAVSELVYPSGPAAPKFAGT